MHHITIDGVSYHCNFKWDHDKGDYDESLYELILDERGEPIPSDECICAAWCSNECCCGAFPVEEGSTYEEQGFWEAEWEGEQ